MRYIVVLVLLVFAGVALGQSMPDKAPPLAVRAQVYEKLSYMTDRDFAMLTPADQAQITCIQIGEKIDIQLEYERHGSHGVYNMDALRHAGPDYCRKYLDSIH